MNRFSVPKEWESTSDEIRKTSNPVAFLLTDVNIFEHHSKASVASLRFIHIASE